MVPFDSILPSLSNNNLPPFLMVKNDYNNNIHHFSSNIIVSFSVDATNTYSKNSKKKKKKTVRFASSLSSYLLDNRGQTKKSILWYSPAELKLIQMKRKGMAKMIQHKINIMIQNNDRQKNNNDSTKENNTINEEKWEEVRKNKNNDNNVAFQNNNKWIIDFIENETTCVRGLENLLVFDDDDAYNQRSNGKDKNNNNDISSLLSSKNLHNSYTKKRKIVRANRMNSIDAVLFEQERQTLIGKYNPNTLAAEYIMNGSIRCRYNAYNQGLQDAVEVI